MNNGKETWTYSPSTNMLEEYGNNKHRDNNKNETYASLDNMKIIIVMLMITD